MVKIAVASVAMGAFLVWFAGTLDAWLQASSSERAVWLAVLVTGGGAIYFAVLLALGVRLHQFKVQTALAAR